MVSNYFSLRHQGEYLHAHECGVFVCGVCVYVCASVHMRACMYALAHTSA